MIFGRHKFSTLLLFSAAFFISTGSYIIAFIELTKDLVASIKDENTVNPLLRRKHSGHNEAGFGACLLVKQDNHLLYEWLAYHVTVLPLHYIVVGSDLGNTEDPANVLDRWSSVGVLNYRILNASDFMHRHKIFRENNDAHWGLVHRQNGFITTCIEILKEKGIKWTLFSDIDEFLVINRLGEDEIKSLTIAQKSQSRPISNESFHIRRSLPPVESDATVLDVINQIEKSGNSLGPCYTIPRLRVGALENVTCPDAQSIVDLVRGSFRFESMSTLRFVQHAKKETIELNRAGKVMMDLSQLSNDTVARKPRGIHRPFKLCLHPFVDTADSYFYLNHYIGSWEQYSARQDGRRNRAGWEEFAYLTSGTSCDQAVHRWFPRFIKQVGEKRAKFLLGVVD